MPVTVGKILTKIFGSRNEGLLKRYRRIVDQVNQFEPKVIDMTDADLRARTRELHEGLVAGKLRSNDVLPEAFAIIRESMDRHIGIRQIFNPEEDPLAPKFDPEQFDDARLGASDEGQRKMPGSAESGQNVEPSPSLYAPPQKMYPESRPPFRARPF